MYLVSQDDHLPTTWFEGFGYVFNALNASINETEENELAQAFGVIFSAARKFRVMTILQVWFPVLRRFVSRGL